MVKLKGIQRMYLTQDDRKRMAGDLLTIGFDGQTLGPELKEVLRETQAAGIILFKRNIESVEQVVELNRELKAFRPERPLSLAIDHEGGRVMRMDPPVIQWPPMMNVGTYDDLTLTQAVGKAMGHELRSLGFDIDFAPVLDVHTNPANPVIGDRAFSTKPNQVGKHGLAFWQGLSSAGVGGCGKHFPGHGDTTQDSHLELPTLEHCLERLREIEWPPFHQAIQGGLDAIMTAHVLFPELDEFHPATFSKYILDILRNELNFEGLIISDDLEMKAAAERYTYEEMPILGLNAGVEHFLICHKPEPILEVYRGIMLGIEQEKISHQTLFEASKSSRKWLDRWTKPKVDPTKWRNIVGHDMFAALCTKLKN